ncbi:MAG TPA: hypothetical protein VLA25_05855, partial [Methylotenera sp.]|nr:hypothetical protein [Methylotenera sp.]
MQIYLIAVVCMILSVSAMSQQRIAININGHQPHSSALLDVQSSTKGVLLPRMIQSQRLAIKEPVAGLLVYDLTTERLYQYQAGVWRFLLNNTYWSKPANGRAWLYNTADSIGIGTAAPAEQLELSNGNLRILNGDIKLTNGDIFLNKTDGTLQLQAVSVDKGFVQLSGNDLRLGVNSANTTG